MEIWFDLAAIVTLAIFFWLVYKRLQYEDREKDDR